MTPTKTTASIAARDQQYKKNDNSNPQQGTGAPPSLVEETPLKITMKSNPSAAMRSPPSKKDNRKLFVGGLPADSKYKDPGVLL